MPKQVRANQKGFYKDRLIQEDEVFYVGDGETGLWFDDVSAQGGDKSTNQYSRMKIDELKEIAVQLGVGLTGDENKAEIIAKLTAE